MRRITIFTFIFFAGVFFSVHRRLHEAADIRNESPENEEMNGGEEEHDDQPFKFQEYLNALKIRDGETESGYPPSYQFMEHKTALLRSASKKLSSTARTLSNNGVLAWTDRGPGNVPGRTRALVVDPDDATHQTWYAGSASGGIWNTTNGGGTWTWLTSTLTNLATTSMAMAASNHNVIYAGTGEGFGNIDGVSGHGVFKSTDRGQTWTLLNSSISFGDINRLVINPATENNVVVASNIGVYFSADGGSTWTQTYTGIVQDLVDTPGNFSVIYGGQYATGVIKSTDGGQTWNLSNSGMSPNGRVELSVSPVNPNRIFVSAEGSISGNNSDMYVSSDAGASWSLVSLTLSSKTVDFLSGAGGQIVQGGYDNTIACSPYSQDVVYAGGVGVYQATLGTSSTTVDNWLLDESTTQSFLLLQQFSNVTYAGGKLNVGPTNPQVNVEVRFGPAMKQLAHRFTVPAGSTSGVPSTSYSYADYDSVNFEVWDVTNNRQLMVSYRDQNGNGKFDLLPQDPLATDPVSREYVFIHGITYAATPDPTVAMAGGQQTNMLYNIFPALASTVTPPWTGSQSGTLKISYAGLAKLSSTTVSVADPYSDYDGKNNPTIIHPDHHCLLPIPVDNVAKTYQILDSNDGGVYLSGISTSPGTTQGGWVSVGTGFNTGQFYGADKRPGADEYLGGLQDNGTQKSPAGSPASSTSLYQSVIGGDGFEVVWNNNNDQKLIGGYYGDHFLRSLNGGANWIPATTGLSTSATEFPFISRLANSKNNPEVLFTTGQSGVWKSANFGGNWALTPITTNWGFTNFIDVDVSVANANIVWAGAGMSATSNIYVSADNGTTFHATQNYTSSTMGVLTRLATHPADPNTAYALFSFASSPKILRTTDLGQTWQDLSGFNSGSVSTNGFPDVAVYCLYIRPDNPNIIWAGTEIGIVESLDNGVSWALLTDFPSVSVWDMKGQDNQIVIATHGRGIWTATVAAPQIGLQNPVLTAYGTSPQSNFVSMVHLPEAYDSTIFMVNGTRAGSISANTIGDYFVRFGNVAAGSVTLNMIGYKNSAPAYTSWVAQQISLLNYQSTYYNYFANGNDFVMNGFTVSPLSGDTHNTMQSAHPYPNAATSSSLLRQPIIVTGSLPNFYYSDVALVEHGPPGAVFGDADFADYVVVEATHDGINWVPLASGYNSLSNAGWLSAFNSGTPGSEALEITHAIDLTQTLAVGDTVLFRFRLTSDTNGITGWGWSVDELAIQQHPTGLDPGANLEADVFPNPAKGSFFVRYTIPSTLPVTINIIDISGRQVASYPMGARNAGQYTLEVSKELNAGSCLVQVQSGSHQLVRQVIVKN